jgi:hypothetical protein
MTSSTNTTRSGRRRRPASAAVAVGLLLAACSGAATEVTTSPASTTTSASLPVDVPTTYVVIDPVAYAGPIEGGGRISFGIRETEDSTRETLADGQVVVYDYEMTDLAVTADAPGECAGIDGPTTFEDPGPFPIDAGGRIEAAAGPLLLEGIIDRSGAGFLRFDLVVDGEACVIGPLSWMANPAE